MVNKKDLKLLYDNMIITGFDYQYGKSLLDHIAEIKLQVKNRFEKYEDQLKKLKGE